MAKKANKKSGLKNIILACLAVVFGAILFCTMFMPLVTSTQSDGTKISACNVLTAMSFADPTEDPIQYAKDIANASNEEKLAYNMLQTDNDGIATKLKVATFFNLFASILGGLLVASVILSMIFRGNLLRTLSISFGILGLLCAIGALVGILMFLGTTSGGIVPVSDFYAIHAASILAIITAAFATVCAWMKR